LSNISIIYSLTTNIINTEIFYNAFNQPIPARPRLPQERLYILAITCQIDSDVPAESEIHGRRIQYVVGCVSSYNVKGEWDGRVWEYEEDKCDCVGCTRMGDDDMDGRRRGYEMEGRRWINGITERLHQ
jgi:hypothetical protein